jgi:hypothetical protein
LHTYPFRFQDHSADVASERPHFWKVGACLHNRLVMEGNATYPAIHDSYLSRTNGVVLTAPPRGLWYRTLTDRRNPVSPFVSVVVFVQLVFRPEFFTSSGSTAKRDQSFICTSPALGEGLHGRLSLGNPPALKQSVQVYREGTSVAQAGYGKDRRELALAESKLQSHRLCCSSAAGAAQNPFDVLA